MPPAPAAAKIAPISGVAYPTPRMRSLATALHGPAFAASIGSMLEDAVAVNALAEALDRAIEAGLSSDGRIDLKAAAVCLIKEMRESQK